MAHLVLGPMLRFVDDQRATVWVETDSACDVEVLGRREATFAVEGHHYAIVVVDGLEPARDHPYEVHLDGLRRWPEPGSALPPSVIRTAELADPADPADPAVPDRPLRVVFGSCRVAAPHEPPFSLAPEDHEEGQGLDALYAYGLRLAERPRSEWPELLALTGDQVYADEAAPDTRRRVRGRPGGPTERPPNDQVGDFEEYTWLYHEAWSEPVVRWLLSTVPSTMIFDDHDLVDDWNTSAEWRREMAEKPWWPEREVGGLMAYWLYQHLGNCSPEQLQADELLGRLSSGSDEGGGVRDLAEGARLTGERGGDGIVRWSFTRDLVGSSRVRLVTIDVRNRRALADGDRATVDADEWRWVDGELTGGFDHLLVVASLPWLLPSGVSDIERWDEAVCAGAWGRMGRRLGERMRQRADLEHWPASSRSFDDLTGAVTEVANGVRGAAPASVLVLSGDVHFSYVAPVSEADDADGSEHSRVVQLVSSPLRSRVAPRMRRQLRFANSWLGTLFGRLLVGLVPVRRHRLRWDVTAGPWFGNGLATLTLARGSARVRFERVELDPSGLAHLVELHEQELVAERTGHLKVR